MGNVAMAKLTFHTRHQVIMMWAAAAVFGLAVYIAPPATGQVPRMELREVADDVYVMQHPTGSSNSVFIVTGEGVVVFDADIRTADQVFTAIRNTTDQPIRFMFVSHPAGDHATGGWHFRDDMPIIIGSNTQAASLAAEELEQFNQRKNSDDPAYATYRAADLFQPNVMFEGSLSVRLGGLTFVLIEEGALHSKSDVTLYIPERRIFAMGDLFKSEMHTGPGDTVYDRFNAAKDWIEGIDRILGRGLEVDTFIPGHGPVHIGVGERDLTELRSYFIAMREAVSTLIEQGMSEEEALREFQVPEEFSHYNRSDTLERFLPLYYRQLR